MSAATEINLVATATRRPGFVHPYCNRYARLLEGIRNLCIVYKCVFVFVCVIPRRS